jgi:hypothetical protein
MPALLAALSHMLLDNPISCDNTWRDFLGEASNRFAMPCTVFSDIFGLPPPCRSNNVPLVQVFSLKVECSVSTAGFGHQTVQQTTSGNLNGTSNPVGLHNEHSLIQRISIHLHYDVKASKHLTSLLTTN